ncbi:MAG: DUF1295 domain-containing protein [Comamonadaceae bacterium]|nr:DUF1295 domain-containing protein [Comamonadaceae bacterium]
MRLDLEMRGTTAMNDREASPQEGDDRLDRFALSCRLRRGGIVLFMIPGDVVLRAFLADVAMTVLVWAASLFVRNASVYDPYWSVVPPFLLLLAVIDSGAVHGTMTMLYLAVLVWSVRLTANWASLWTDFSEQDWRYDMFRQKAPETLAARQFPSGSCSFRR